MEILKDSIIIFPGISRLFSEEEWEHYFSGDDPYSPYEADEKCVNVRFEVEID